MQVLPEVTRRTLLQRIAALAGAASIPAACADFSGGSPDEFAFTESQFLTLTSLADTIIPGGQSKGALDIGVPALFDRLMRNWAARDRREQTVAALDRLDEAARQEGSSFSEMDPATRQRFARPYDVAALRPGPPRVESAGGASEVEGPSYMDSGYGLVKQLIVLLFYYSEHGQTVEMNYVHVPGRWEPSVPLTPQTRAEGGIGSL